jgi:hypothetical protein
MEEKENSATISLTYYTFPERRDPCPANGRVWELVLSLGQGPNINLDVEAKP